MPVLLSNRIRLIAMAMACAAGVFAARPPAKGGTVQKRLPPPDDKPAWMERPVQVFILMGEINMLGMGDVSPTSTRGTLEYLIKKEQKFTHLMDASGKWTARKDVRFVQVTPKGDTMTVPINDWLTVKGKTIGPELQFGHIMGYVLDNPVLILKACNGNRSLGWDMLPPGSERFSFDGKIYAGYKDNAPSWVDGQPKKAVSWYAGKEYDDDVTYAKQVMANIGDYYPGAKKCEVAGFVWWHGYKDQNAALASRYEQNLVRLINSLRQDFNAPKAPFVIATLGFRGNSLAEPGLTIANAQLAVANPKKYPAFAGNVKTIDSRIYWRDASVSPKNQDYTYNHNAEIFMDVGDALGWSMADMLVNPVQ